MSHVPPFPSRDDVITTQAPRNRFTKRIADWLQAVVDSVETLDTRASSLVAQDAALLMADVALVAAVAALQPATGVWTPALTFGGAAVGLTYSDRGGWWARLGNVVTVSGRIILSANGSSTGTATVAGLPVAAMAATPNPNYTGAVLSGAMVGLTSGVLARVQGGSTVIDLLDTGTTGVAVLDESNFGATSVLTFAFSYLVQP